MPRASGGFPDLELRDLEGAPRRFAEAWARGPALIVLGHRNCKTTRETLPLVERIHARRGPGAAVLAVLQDDPETARALREKLALELPIRLEPDPYPLAAALEVTTVPTTFLVARGGEIAAVSEALRRADLEAFAARLGVEGALFTPEDKVPALKPG
jgi:peroxiredoxin